ncbi:hypothetical protein Ciccas_002348 [Cichlidogyrus casuarinus]|uniref:gamma-glutamylcyclotransferase n=1 Tax=Cichlidogyrus casuarinus TaxID=1844966 RepID=A0ABD2QHG2_9PLAT
MLKTNRMKLVNPSAEYVGIGVAKKHKVQICKPTVVWEVWKGSTANIVVDDMQDCYGAIWTLDQEDRANLDRQEGVDLGLYEPFNIEVLFEKENKVLQCLCYQMPTAIPCVTSVYYLDVILRGAREINLPDHYIEYLRSIPTNDYLGPCPKYDQVLEKMPENQKSCFEMDQLRKRPVPTNRFYYFSYGSNLLRERITMANPSAKYVGIGRVKDYQLIMCKREEPSTWGGGTASIVPSSGEECFGAIWTLDYEDRCRIDRQEGVQINLYYAFEFDVYCETLGHQVHCLCYRMTDETPSITSPYYLDVILRGAKQCNLPASYLEKLQKIPVNEFSGPCKMYQSVLALIPPEEGTGFLNKSNF